MQKIGNRIYPRHRRGLGKRLPQYSRGDTRGAKPLCLRKFGDAWFDFYMHHQQLILCQKLHLCWMLRWTS
ncbi:hypothetical protein B9J78_01790 [bacterium Unc6]|nr:hypothetical protein [bacterium Unc6]